jgi:hypothetical protein
MRTFTAGPLMSESKGLQERYLELIKLTKEYLVLKKEEESTISMVSLIKNARIYESIGRDIEIIMMKMPLSVQQFVQTNGNLEEAEKKSLEKLDELRSKMIDISDEIKRLTAQLEQRTPTSKSPEP